MSLFNFFKTARPVLNGIKFQQAESIHSEGALNPAQEIDKREEEVRIDTHDVSDPSPDIPESIFVEYEIPKPKSNMEQVENAPEIIDLQKLYSHLEQNFEENGYEDALVNPDTSYMDEHVQYIHNELNLMISRVKTYYKGHLTKVEFHISTRQRSGMVETVDELVSHKATMEEELASVHAIEEDLKKGIGLSQNLFLSYKRGFRNGFAAITYNTILNKR